MVLILMKNMYIDLHSVYGTIIIPIASTISTMNIWTYNMNGAVRLCLVLIYSHRFSYLKEVLALEWHEVLLVVVN